ncbi:hypothetical protein SAMN02745108_02942, partial [Fibrobacter intestinalis]
SVHQRFRLRKEIGKQFLVVVADLIVAIRRSDNFTLRTEQNSSTL